LQSGEKRRSSCRGVVKSRKGLEKDLPRRMSGVYEGFLPLGWERIEKEDIPNSSA